MTVLNQYGYEDGLLSNSMLQAAITCPYKYQKLYLEKVDPAKHQNWFNGAFVGTVVHKCLELHDDNLELSLAHMWTMLVSVFGEAYVARTQSLMAIYGEAKAATMADGMKWGRVYKAPEMTGFWKKSYTGLDNLLAQLDADVTAHVDGVFEEPYTVLVRRMITCLNNWPSMRISDATAHELQVKGKVGPDEASYNMVGTIDRLERRSSSTVAICDYKTGRWPYTVDTVANSDQFGLYDRLLPDEVVEWVVYELYSGETVRVRPSSRIRESFQLRLDTNLRYFKQIQSVFGIVEVPIPAGSSFKLGCPCILADAGECPYYIKYNGGE